MAELPEFQRRQFAFAAHVRDPEHRPAPEGVEDRRMAIYRELFFNNLSKLLSSAFPVATQILSPGDWRRLVRAFMVNHRAHTPYFLEIPREFLNFLENNERKKHAVSDGEPDFLVELAHYEWLELAVSVAPDEEPPPDVDADGDLLRGAPAVSAVARLASYRYPVQRISPAFLPSDPGEQATHLVVYRRADDEVGFMELNPVTARLLALLGANEERLGGRALLERLSGEIGYGDTRELVRHGAAALAEMRDKGILLGARRAA